MSEQTFLLIVVVLMAAVFVALLSFLSAVLWQLVKILREVRGIMGNIRQGSDTLKGDLSELRSHLKAFLIGRMSRPNFFGKGRMRSRRSASSKDNPSEEEEKGA